MTTRDEQRTDVAAIAAARDRALAALVEAQHEEGYWWGELESNASIAAEHCFLLHLFGAPTDAERDGLRAELVASARPDGGWANWYSGPVELSTTIEAYYALKLLGVSTEDPILARARAHIMERGGANQARFFTRLWLAVMGQYPYDALPRVPAELFLLPARFPLAPVYRLASWARGTFVPILVVLALRPRTPLAVGIDELFQEAAGSAARSRPRRRRRWMPVLRAVDATLAWYDRHPVAALRRRALRDIERWIVERQEADGSWGGIQPPWVYSLIALHALGRPLQDPVIARGRAGFAAFSVRDEERLRVQACISPVWDTALAAIAIADASEGAPHDATLRAGEWLLGREVRHRGDWFVRRRRGAPGGWAFEFVNDWYPDVDDTAEVLIALRRSGVADGHPAVVRGVAWLRAMQSRNGGWGAFDVDNTSTILAEHPACDFGAVTDPPTEDVTAHAIEALVACGVPIEDAAIRRGIAFLWRTQRDDGSWWGRWGVNHVYGTGAVVPALVAAGVAPTDARIRRAIAWLAAHQNADGGFGESVASYVDPAWIGRGDSTPSQTAWALLAFVAADRDHPAARRAADFLVASQNPGGDWDEPWFTGTGFPRDFMINYHLYRHYFPLSALGRYLA